MDLTEVYIGEIRMWAGTYAPDGWLMCNGGTYAVAQYQALYSLIGNYYGGSAPTSFAVPDLRGRVPVNYGHGPGLTNYYQVGLQNGAKMNALVASNLPPVEVEIPAYNDNATIDTPNPDLCLAKSCSATSSKNTVQIYGDETPNTTINGGNLPGSSTPFSIVQPVLSVCFIMAWDGMYPQRP